MIRNELQYTKADKGFEKEGVIAPPPQFFSVYLGLRQFGGLFREFALNHAWITQLCGANATPVW